MIKYSYKGIYGYIFFGGENMEITISWIFGIISSGAMGFIGWSLKELYGRMKTDKEETRETINSLENKIENVMAKTEEKIYRVENKLTENYVAKEDFYREINKLDMKLDAIGEKIAEMSKNIAALVGKERN